MKGRTSHKRNKRSICVNLLLSMLLLISSVPLWPSKAANAAAEGSYLLSLNRPVYSSSSLGGNTADHAVDGNKNTRWESVWQQDPQWIYVDLGAVASISNISIEWENAYASAFDLEVSDDEVNWKQVYSTTKGQGGLTEVEVDAKARYVRLFSHERVQQAYGVSLYAFDVYGTGGANPPPKPAAANLALGKSVMASSEEIDEPSRSAEDKAKMEKRNYEARNVTDDDPGTRWSSIYKDQEWIVVDLGQSREIGNISLQWENAFGRAYDIQVSSDAKQWTTLYRELHSNGGRDDIPVYAEARYVKFAGLGRGTTNGYSLYAFDVYEYIQGDEKPVYTIPAIPEMSSVRVGAGSYAINDITMLQPKNPKNRTADITAPIPSNDWWQSILVSDLGDGNSLVTLPFKNRYTKQGLHILNPGAGYLSADGNSMDADGEADLILTTSSMNPAKVNTKVAGYGDYSANIIMSDDDTAKVNTTFVKGSPFLYNTFENPDTILLRSPSITRLFDDQNREIMLKDGESWTGDHIGIEVTNQDRAPSPQTFTRNYGLYAPEGTTLIKLGNTLKIKLGSNENYLSLATLPSASELAYYYQHAYAFVTNTKVDYNYNESTSQVTTTFNSVTQTKRADFSEKTLMALFPHQWKIATTPLTELTYPSIRGMMKVSEGNSFTTQDRFYGIIPQFVEPDDPTYSRAQLISYLDQLDADTSGNVMSEDPYWQGKKLHPLALGVLISDQLGDDERRDHYLSLLRNILTDWYTYSPDERLHSYYFYYSEQWGTIFPYGSGFGVNTGLTDHHFTYGYYVFASAVLAMYDPTFVEDYGDMVELLIRDYANPSHTDDQFPWMRNFDPYSGHSWAGGYADNRSGNNQEAAGEALFSWVGQYMWGEVTGNKAYRDTGIWGFVTEEKAAEQYWFNYDGDNWLEGYKHATVGHVYGSAYLYGTYFSNDAEHIYGIHWLPPAEWMTYYGRDPKNTAALYNGLIKDLGGQQERTWQHIIWPFQSIGDPEAALAKWNTKDMQQNEVFNAYWFMHSMASTGTRTMDIWADSPAATVYEKDGVYTAQIWNPSDTAKTVRFYNASGALGSATVYAKAQVKVNPLENTVVKQPDASQGVTYLDRSSWTITASSSSEAVERMIDGDLSTRWSSGQTQQPGDWLHIDLGSEQMMDTLFMNSGNNWGDYAQGYEVYVSKDDENWSKPIAQGTGTSPSLSVDLGMQTVRYIKIVLTAPADSWWSISELKLARFGKFAQAPEHPNPTPSPLPDRSTWIVTASSTQGTDITAHMLDGKKDTLWTNGRKQTEGQWITIDLGQTSAFDAVELDSGNAKDDYPRQYRIFVSDDGQNWGTSIAGGEGVTGRLSISFPEQQARYVKIMQTGKSDQWWSVSELFVHHYGTGKQKRLVPDGWSVTASSNEEDATVILDGSDQTRWTSSQTQTGGEWLQLDLGHSQTVNRIVLDSAHSSDDYARGYEVFTSMDGTDWGEAVATGEGENAVLSIAFTPHEARYIKIVQTGTDSHWWSVAEIAVYTADQTPWKPGEQDELLPTELDRTSWTVTASTPEDVSALLDDDLNSRWTSASGQQPDQWIQIDLGSIQNFSRLTMDSGSSTNDYARNFTIVTSTNGEQWDSVSEAAGTDPLISVMFTNQKARYVKIALTTDNAKWWWSIAELKLYH